MGCYIPHRRQTWLSWTKKSAWQKDPIGVGTSGESGEGTLAAAFYADLGKAPVGATDEFYDFPRTIVTHTYPSTGISRKSFVKDSTSECVDLCLKRITSGKTLCWHCDNTDGVVHTAVGTLGSLWYYYKPVTYPATYVHVFSFDSETNKIYEKHYIDNELIREDVFNVDVGVFVWMYMCNGAALTTLMSLNLGLTANEVGILTNNIAKFGYSFNE